MYEPEYGLPNVIGCIPPYKEREFRLRGGILYLICDVLGLLVGEPSYDIIKPIGTYNYEFLSKITGTKKLRQQYYNFPFGWFDNDFIISQRILKELGLEFNIEELKLILYYY